MLEGRAKFSRGSIVNMPSAAGAACRAQMLHAVVAVCFRCNLHITCNLYNNCCVIGANYVNLV